jgi:hypothetical protein
MVPFALVGYWVTSWQLPTERLLEQRLLSAQSELANYRGRVLVAPGPVGSSSGSPGEVDYDMLLRLGPLDYRDATNTSRAFNVAAVRIQGRLLQGGRLVAECFSSTGPLPSPAAFHRAAAYRHALGELDFRVISVDCRGVAPSRNTTVTAQGLADVSVSGQSHIASWCIRTTGLASAFCDDLAGPTTPSMGRAVFAVLSFSEEYDDDLRRADTAVIPIRDSAHSPKLMARVY